MVAGKLRPTCHHRPGGRARIKYKHRSVRINEKDDRPRECPKSFVLRAIRPQPRQSSVGPDPDPSLVRPSDARLRCPGIRSPTSPIDFQPSRPPCAEHRSRDKEHPPMSSRGYYRLVAAILALGLRLSAAGRPTPDLALDRQGRRRRPGRDAGRRRAQDATSPSGPYVARGRHSERAIAARSSRTGIDAGSRRSCPAYPPTSRLLRPQEPAGAPTRRMSGGIRFRP